MPHTSHKKKSTHNKRKEVVDENGWTEVTSLPLRESPPVRTRGGAQGANPLIHVDEPFEESWPFEAGNTHAKLQEKYEKIEEKWLASHSWVVLKQTLKDRILPENPRIDNCVVLGTGSPTGVRVTKTSVYHRHDVALFQIAIFKSIADVIGRS